jgi:hypothetical protein
MNGCKAAPLRHKYMAARTCDNTVYPGGSEDFLWNIGEGSSGTEKDPVAAFPGGFNFPDIIVERAGGLGNQCSVYIKKNRPRCC